MVAQSMNLLSTAIDYAALFSLSALLLGAVLQKLPVPAPYDLGSVAWCTCLSTACSLVACTTLTPRKIIPTKLVLPYPLSTRALSPLAWLPMLSLVHAG